MLRFKIKELISKKEFEEDRRVTIGEVGSSGHPPHDTLKNDQSAGIQHRNGEPRPALCVFRLSDRGFGGARSGKGRQGRYLSKVRPANSGLARGEAYGRSPFCYE